jgi:hypothetical protein
MTYIDSLRQYLRIKITKFSVSDFNYCAGIMSQDEEEIKIRYDRV